MCTMFDTNRAARRVLKSREVVTRTSVRFDHNKNRLFPRPENLRGIKLSYTATQWILPALCGLLYTCMLITTHTLYSWWLSGTLSSKDLKIVILWYSTIIHTEIPVLCWTKKTIHFGIALARSQTERERVPTHLYMPAKLETECDLNARCAGPSSGGWQMPHICAMRWAGGRCNTVDLVIFARF